MIDIKSMLPEEILEYTQKELKAPKFRATQIIDWLSKGVTKFEDMKNLPKNLVETLNSICYISVANIEKKLVSRYDGTVKYLFSFEDKECVEAVVMKYNHGYSMCISTQVGCKMGCTFCATGMGGFTRQLLPSEMVAQIEAAQRDLNIRISNIVLMGMGEPLDNYANVVKFIGLCQTRNFSISAPAISPFLPADLFLKSMILQRRALVLHFPFHCMHHTTSFAQRQCLSIANIP